MSVAPGADGSDGGDDRIRRLEQRLDAVESVLAIQELKARYGALVDARFARGAVVDRDRLELLARRAADLFCEDGTWDGGPGLGIARGRTEIAARLAAPTIVFSRHFFVTPTIAETATAFRNGRIPSDVKRSPRSASQSEITPSVNPRSRSSARRSSARECAFRSKGIRPYAHASASRKSSTDAS